MRILGIDPGSVITGYGVVDYERGKLTLEPRGLVTRNWLGKAAGKRVENGRYVLVIKARDMAGNLGTLRTPIRVTR